MRKPDLRGLWQWLHRKVGLNIILSLAYVMILLLALSVVSVSVLQYTARYLLAQRETEQTDALRACALSVTPFLGDMDVDSVYEYMSECSIGQNGRMLYLDSNGVVQVDTFSTLNGTVPELEEVQKVLSGACDTATGYHKLSVNASAAGNRYLPEGGGSYWAAYYVCTVSADGVPAGAVLLSSPVQDVVQKISSLRSNLLWLSTLFILATAIITFLIFHRLTGSFRNFNTAIIAMAGGDFSVRVSEKDFAELGELARAFNSMSAKLENLENSRSRFVSDASHELKTPLASMKVLSDSLLSSPDAPPEMYREFMTDINHEIDRLNLVINDLLTLVRMDRGDDLEITPVDLTGLVEQVLETVRPLAENKHIRLEMNSSAVTAQVDELRMQRVLINLVDNAIKYSPENTDIVVSVSSTISNAVLSVEDHGIGISQEHLSHLFERFYRVDKARSRSTGGTGLGLSIVRQIVEAHNGHIEVKSALGEGSVFTITIPLTHVEKEAPHETK